MMKKAVYLSLIFLGLTACDNKSGGGETKPEVKKDTLAEVKPDTIAVAEEKPAEPCAHDSLNALANIISGKADTSGVYRFVQESAGFKVFSKNFDKRWNSFDSTRLKVLRNFRENELSKGVNKQAVLFYPFSGPDVLYMHTFFPDAEKYIMVGLEPVGSLPKFKKDEIDSLDGYFHKVNSSLNAILKFSFFRTQSMKKDLRSDEVDGTIHLLFLFLKRTGNMICSARPVTIDSSGNLVNVKSFEELKKMRAKTKGVEIEFSDKNNKHKTLYYFSLNAHNEVIKHNKGFLTYMQKTGNCNTYLKGASYLMHEAHFSVIRELVLNKSEQVIQDDSGIALRFFLNDDEKWNFKLYGQYTKPIPIFSMFYQSRLDSLYDVLDPTPIGFGIGYNFKDKNSNFMIASKQH